jgi:hypothetical protein
MVTGFPYDFHDAGLAAVELGPRREASLTAALAMPGRMGNHLVTIRFGGIANFNEVEAFFAGVPAGSSSDRFIDRVYVLGYDRNELQRCDRRVVHLELETYGHLTIRCRTVTAWQHR